MDKQIFRQLLNRPLASHKYDFGHILVVGGSAGMVGAPLLSAMASLRVGAGLVTIASLKHVIDKLEKRVLEVMTLELEDVAPQAQLQEFIKDRKVSVLLIGPGMETRFANRMIGLTECADMPTIVDGGGLSALQNQKGLFRKKASQPLILTPHLGEFQRFFKEELPKKPSMLKKIASRFANEHHLILVLKGQVTYICGPGPDIYENTSGTPALATAGTGDVLSGMIAGILAQGIEPVAATKAAVYLHGLAGTIAAEAKTEPSVIASDVIESIPKALKLVLHQEL